MAHHVQKKATKKHAANRPKKSRPSDRLRAPTNYPPLPDTPWMQAGAVDDAAYVPATTVQITVAPADTLATIKEKLSAAGAAAPEAYYFEGKEVTGSLADAGLDAEATISATVFAR